MRNQQQTKRDLFMREKEKDFTKKNFPRMLLLADLSFAIDAQHDKRSPLQDWYPGCSWCIPQVTTLSICFF
jgi:hypothetical protein